MRRISDVCRAAYVWFKVESEQGIAAVEYGLLAALIAVVIVTAVTLLGTNLKAVFNSVANSI
jgi:pilus assembly protein Flp/PilA